MICKVTVTEDGFGKPVAVYISVKLAEISSSVKTVQLGMGVFADYDRDGDILGIELLGPFDEGSVTTVLNNGLCMVKTLPTEREDGATA